MIQSNPLKAAIRTPYNLTNSLYVLHSGQSQLFAATIEIVTFTDTALIVRGCRRLHRLHVVKGGNYGR